MDAARLGFDAKKEFDPRVHEENGGGASTVVLRRPGALPDLPARAEHYEHPHSSLARGVKRTVDLIGSLLILVVLTPLLVVIATLIKLDSPGPVLFRQRRIGRDSEPFEMLKFRTMVDGADEHRAALRHLNEAGEGLFKIDGDPRVTRIGRWLRATSLDELPQLLHVVTGRMSLVGPRPLVPEEDVLIQGDHRVRLSVRPGMTGVWQISGASAIPIAELVKIDRAYVEDWSLWLDAKVLTQTAWHVVSRKSL